MKGGNASFQWNSHEWLGKLIATFPKSTPSFAADTISHHSGTDRALCHVVKLRDVPGMSPREHSKEHTSRGRAADPEMPPPWAQGGSLEAPGWVQPGAAALCPRNGVDALPPQPSAHPPSLGPHRGALGPRAASPRGSWLALGTRGLEQAHPTPDRQRLRTQTRRWWRRQGPDSCHSLGKWSQMDLTPSGTLGPRLTPQPAPPLSSTCRALPAWESARCGWGGGLCGQGPQVG